MRVYLLLAIALFSLPLKAHQTDVSTTMLVEQKEKIWLVQVVSALSAFQQELSHNYPDFTYTTAEEFNKKLGEYVKENIIVCFNNRDTLHIKEVFIKLGHEAKAVCILEAPKEALKTVYVKNTVFADLYHHKSALVVFKEGVTQEQFILNAENNYTQTLKIEANKFTLVNTKKKENKQIQVYVILAIAATVFGIGTVLYRFNRKNLKKSV